MRRHRKVGSSSGDEEIMIARDHQTWIAVLLLVTLAAFGCATRGYHARSLPADLQAPPATTSYRETLSKLSRSLPPSDTIQPGDLLEVMVAAQAAPPAPAAIPLRVSEDGSITVPLVGRVSVAGLRASEAEAVIAQTARDRGIYTNPVVSVSIKKPRTVRVVVIGAVKKEGVYELPATQSTLLDALMAAGSLTDDAGPRIEIYRSQSYSNIGPQLVSQETAEPNLLLAGASSRKGSPPPGPETIVIDLANGESLIAGEYRLRDGDVIIISKQPPRSVYVLGLVNRPGKIDIPPGQDLFLLDALAMAGGRSSELADRVQIMRQRGIGGQPVQIVASVRQAKTDPQANLRLAPGDVISVEDTPITMLERAMRYFFRFGVSASVPIF